MIPDIPAILCWLQVRAGRPLVLTGDLNAAPSESVITSLASSLQSAYSLASTEYTSWKVRESGEEKQVHRIVIFGWLSTNIFCHL